MRTMSRLLGYTVLLFATGALAGTKVQLNIVPTPPDCFTGPGFCQNVEGSCVVDNSECALGTISPKSKFKLDGKRNLKVKVKGVTDVTGALITTGPAETATDNLVLKFVVSSCEVDIASPPLCDETINLYVKMVLTDGKGSVKLALSTVAALGPVGSPIGVYGVTLWASPGLGNCLGSNSPADITTRIGDGTCEASSTIRGVGGMVAQ